MWGILTVSQSSCCSHPCFTGWGNATYLALKNARSVTQCLCVCGIRQKLLESFLPLAVGFPGHKNVLHCCYSWRILGVCAGDLFSGSVIAPHLVFSRVELWQLREVHQSLASFNPTHGPHTSRPWPDLHTHTHYHTHLYSCYRRWTSEPLAHRDESVWSTAL